jgi:hypothetical protein
MQEEGLMEEGVSEGWLQEEEEEEEEEAESKRNKHAA